jgi:hypothetical protein
MGKQKSRLPASFYISRFFFKLFRKILDILIAIYPEKHGVTIVLTLFSGVGLSVGIFFLFPTETGWKIGLPLLTISVLGLLYFVIIEYLMRSAQAKMTRELARGAEILIDKETKILREEGRVDDDFLKKYLEAKQILDRLKSVREEDFREEE